MDRDPTRGRGSYWGGAGGPGGLLLLLPLLLAAPLAPFAAAWDRALLAAALVGVDGLAGAVLGLGGAAFSCDVCYCIWK